MKPKTFKDMYLREQKMCGFRSEKELGIVYAVFMVILIVTILK